MSQRVFIARRFMGEQQGKKVLMDELSCGHSKPADPQRLASIHATDRPPMQTVGSKRICNREEHR